MIKNLGIKTKRFYELVLQGDDLSLNLWILFLIAIIIRLSFLPWIINLPMAGDEENYWEWATDKFDLKYFFRPPLWPLLLHIPGLLFKHPLSGRILTMIIGAFSPLFVFLLARLLFNRRVGYLAGLIYAIYPEHVAYSHYLWAEILFGFLCLISTYLFFKYLKENSQNKMLIYSSIVAGIALLAKEFSIVLFFAMVTTLVFNNLQNKLKKILLFTFLYFLPLIAYFLIGSFHGRKPINLYYAVIGNFREAIGLSFSSPNALARPGEPGALTSTKELVSEIRNRKLNKTFLNFKKNLYNLWTPNSFPIFRLLSAKPSPWSYGVSKPWFLVLICVSFYIIIVTTGLSGMTLSEDSPFKQFSFFTLSYLSLTSVIALLVSRFRLPFMFPLIIYSAYFLTNYRSLLKNTLKRKRALLGLLICLIIFIHIIFVKYKTFGQWG